MRTEKLFGDCGFSCDTCSTNFSVEGLFLLSLSSSSCDCCETHSCVYTFFSITDFVKASPVLFFATWKFSRLRFRSVTYIELGSSTTSFNQLLTLTAIWLCSVGLYTLFCIIEEPLLDSVTYFLELRSSLVVDLSFYSKDWEDFLFCCWDEW